jgi:Domain of unknown function (DUF4062)
VQSGIRTPDQRLRVFVSSTMNELAPERRAAQRAIERPPLIPVLFELGARPYQPRDLYLAYMRQSHVYVGIYGQQYGWIAPGRDISGLEDEYRAVDVQSFSTPWGGPRRTPSLRGRG